MARREHVSTNPAVRQRNQEVKDGSVKKRNFSHRISKAAAAKMKREATRKKILQEAEDEKGDDAAAAEFASSMLDFASGTLTFPKPTNNDEEIGKM